MTVAVAAAKVGAAVAEDVPEHEACTTASTSVHAWVLYIAKPTHPGSLTDLKTSPFARQQANTTLG